MNSSNIRNFVITAHIDHGKSTLADRLLEITGTVAKDKLVEQYLDANPIERERGITIKLAPARMEWAYNNQNYILNLIDTPGHVDFSYEVSRSLAAVEGAILVVDATSGIQAQTINNIYKAIDQDLTIIPVINKVDLPNAEPEKVAAEMIETFGFRRDEIIFISAKTGNNVEEVLKAIIEKVPPPQKQETPGAKALVFDSQYDAFKGVVAHIRVFEGEFKRGQKFEFMRSGATGDSIEVGVFTPNPTPTDLLSEGEIGYIATGFKDVAQARVGDTITLLSDRATTPIEGYKEVKPMVYAGIYPVDSDDFRALADALGKLKLNDSSLVYEQEMSEALGFGFRVGFLGLLHMEVIQERLEREYNLSIIASLPTVKYKVETTKGEEIIVERPAKLPDPSSIRTIEEPFVLGKVIVPQDYLGPVISLLHDKRGVTKHMEYKGIQVFIDVELPLAEIVIDFFDKLKNVSSGFASFDYEPIDYRPTSAVKLDILVAKEPVDALSQIVASQNAPYIGRRLVEKLKDAIPRQQFEISVQAAIGSKVLARADISAYRKDVTGKLYGGDRTRKDKLLEAQKKGKKRMKMFGKVEIPQEAFLSVLKI